MRAVVRLFDVGSETFAQRFTVAQLCKLHTAWLASDWIYPPCDWDDRQIREALRGVAPDWTDEAIPIYAKKTKPAK